jgi:hypothetical protein
MAIINKILTNPAPMLSSKPPAKGAPMAKKMIESITLERPSDTAEMSRRFEKIAVMVKTIIEIRIRTNPIMERNSS